MITFYKLGELGRLGNQLFQYAALRSIGLENSFETGIPNPKFRHWHGQACLLDRFNIESKFLGDYELGSSIKFSYDEKNHHTYDPEIFSIQDGTDINGFFQSTFYFEKHKEQICKELTPRKEYIDFAKDYLQQFKKDGAETVSIHLRRGDQVDGTNKEYLTFYGESDIFDKNSVYGSYLSNALENFEGKNVNYLVFTGGSRTGDDEADIDWAKRNFQKPNWHVCGTNDPMKDFSLIMNCDHNIVCHLTTFGWWAAYLNPNKDKLVVAPKNYFYDMPPDYVRPGFFPKEWRLV